MWHTATCKFCQTKFTAKLARAAFCTSTCRTKYHHARRKAAIAAFDPADTDTIIDAAVAHAAHYADDPRPGIETDVINAFYAGVDFATKRS